MQVKLKLTEILLSILIVIELLNLFIQFNWFLLC